MAAREHGDGLFVLCQGHPEYGTLSLLREYRRDVRRYLFGRGAVPYPRLPDGLPQREPPRASSRTFERRRPPARHDPRELWASFPYDEVAASVENTLGGPVGDAVRELARVGASGVVPARSV